MSHSPVADAGAERSLRSSTRNPRRRQRQSDTESVKNVPRRKRGKISEDTYLPPRIDEENEDAVREEAKVNGTIEENVGHFNAPVQSTGRARARLRTGSFAALETDMPVRNKRTSVRRPRGDGSTVLTHTERYSAKLLPSTPKDLRKKGVDWRGSIGDGSLAVAVTRTRAYIWDYTAHSTITNPKVFELPFVEKTADALPFAALVSTGATTEAGLLIVSATTGTVVFYESVERAATLGLFQGRHIGTEGSLGSLFSGESVSDIVSLHHAAFIVVLSSGRLAYLSLRDTQGKARILVQFLKALDATQGGFFGSIKGLLGAGAWKRDVAAVRTRQLGPRGQMQVISLTENVELQTWDLEWSGQYTFGGTLDLREPLTLELHKLNAPELRGKCEYLRVQDFVLFDRTPVNSTEIATVGTSRPLDVLVLLQAGRSGDCEYVVAGVRIEGDKVLVHQLLKLPTYHQGPAEGLKSRPRLLLPAPGHTAVAIFPDAIAIRELDQTDSANPDDQLQASLGQSTTFEDAIFLRQDRALTSAGVYEENERGGNESLLLFVNGAGVMRLTISKPDIGEYVQRIPVKNKIEQAVFHGALQEGNILDFSRITDGLYSTEEIREATLEVSAEILRSTSSFLSNAPTSMEHHLAYRAQALRALVTHTRRSFPALSIDTMWQLLWDAERMAAAQQLWKLFEDQVAACDQTQRITTAMYDVCRMTDAELGTEEAENSTDDVVKRFFIFKLHHLDRLLGMTLQFLRGVQESTDINFDTKIRLVGEVDDIWNQAMTTVFDFRTDNASTYGILPESIQDGILVDSVEYVGLPEFWTSKVPILKAITRVAELSRKIPCAETEKLPAGTPIPDSAGIVGRKNPRLIESMSAMWQEYVNWHEAQPSEQMQEAAARVRRDMAITRHNHIRELADVAQTDAGIRLAEKFHDMRTLTEMVVSEMQYAIEALLQAPDHGKPEIQKRITELTEKVSAYFERFGEAWANAYFDEGFASKHAGVMLRDAQIKWQAPLTTYLRADPSRARIAWINEITSGKNFERAFKSLNAAQGQASKMWEKKVDLSMSKLCLLAAEEDLESNGQPMTEDAMQRNAPDGELEIVDIQSRLYQHLLPEIRHCIDHQAEVEVAMQKFAFKNQDLHAMRQLLETYLDRLLDLSILSADELIDVLTLLDNVIGDEDDPYSLQGTEFSLALKVLNAMADHIPHERLAMLQQLIWKRCYVYDDWHDINGGQKQNADEVAEQIQATAAFRTLYHVFDTGSLDDPDSRVRWLLPSECLGAGCRPEDLSYRWPDPDLLDPILKDNKIQDEQLQSFVDDRRLDDRIAQCAEDVKRMLGREAEAEADENRRKREFESSLLQEESDAKTNGHALNGTVNGFAHDGDDDVEMVDQSESGAV